MVNNKMKKKEKPMNNIHDCITEIAKEIKSRPCYYELKKQEELLENDEEVIRLSNDFSKAQIDYSDGLKHYEDGSIELKKLFEKVKETKTKLDSHPLVIEYYRIFSEVNEPLNYIQFKLISLFNHKGLTCEEK